jgi:hypothetical protein
MSGEALLQRFDTVVQSANELLVRQYLEEARCCFAVEAYNGAVVMAWNAAARYLRQVVKAISVVLFVHNYRVLFGQDPPTELWRINDNMFIQTCQRMGVLNEVISGLDSLRNRRNDCAHPSGLFVSAEEAVELVESSRNLVSRRIADERLTNLAILREFVKSAEERDSRDLARWIQDNLCPQLAHDLLTILLRDDEVQDASVIISLWRGLWHRLKDDQREHLWNRLERAIPTILQDDGAALLTPEKLVQVIVWPPSDEIHEARDRVGRLYIEWFETLVQEGEFRALDMDLARELRQHLPEPLRGRLQTVLEEMMRRYTDE